MSLQKFGLRYERLLILSAPISLVCILVAFVAIASDAGNEKNKAACYDVAASIIEKHSDSLTKAWNKREKIGNTYFSTEYTGELGSLVVAEKYYRNCDGSILRQHGEKNISPSEFLEKLKGEASRIRAELSKKPIRSYGIEIPEKVSITFFGISITVGVITLSQVMQLVLAPVLLLWLGSLFNTRYRETLLIEMAKSISELHPHAINIYMNSKRPELKKRRWVAFYLLKLIPVFPLIVRLLMLSIFLIPPSLFFGISLFYLGGEEYFIASLLAGVLVSLFTIFNLVLEINPWHALKCFPGPLYYSQQR